MSRFGSVRLPRARGDCPHREGTAFAGRNHPAGRVTPDYVEQWQLCPDGPPIHGDGSSVLPVLTADGVRAVLKIGDAEHEHLALRRWSGRGAVRLLRADPHHRALLLERLSGETLRGLPDVDACAVIAGLYCSLHVPAMRQLRTLRTELDHWRRDFSQLPRNAAIPHRLVEQAIGIIGELGDEPQATVLHGNLHYATVLAAEREPWLAIAPNPVNGDPHYEVAPMLWSRWDDLAGDVRDGVRRRFYTLVDAAGFDEERARAWVIVRVVRAAMRDPDGLTRYVAVAKAVLG
jgi:streptomycin 6-kinase